MGETQSLVRLSDRKDRLHTLHTVIQLYSFFIKHNIIYYVIAYR